MQRWNDSPEEKNTSNRLPGTRQARSQLNNLLALNHNTNQCTHRTVSSGGSLEVHAETLQPRLIGMRDVSGARDT